jgi:PadR family transcriptional regulator, regulatory protein PadR
MPGGCSGGRCSGRRGTLVEPTVLAVLMTQRSHGYDLHRLVSEMTAGRVQADVGGLYRILRRLEEEGFVTSEWAEGDSGPQRRDYRITEEGRELAREWMSHLRQRAELTTCVAELLESASEEGNAQ